MNYEQAIKIALKALDKEIQRMAPNANLYEIYLADCGKGAYEYRKQLREARAVLSGQQVMRGFT